MPTTDRILDTALDLFNEQGVSAVSTNHIAAGAGISPGNLYYHFRNKDEIVRGLFERLFDAWDLELTFPPDHTPGPDDVATLVRRNFDVMWHYRSAYRELPAILRRDEVLRARWLEVRRRGYTDFRESFSTGKQASDPEAVGRMADLCWLISEFWLPSLEVSGLPVSAVQLQRGVDLMLYVLRSPPNSTDRRKASL